MSGLDVESKKYALTSGKCSRSIIACLERQLLLWARQLPETMFLVYAFFGFVFFLLNGKLFMYTLSNNTTKFSFTIYLANDHFPPFLGREECDIGYFGRELQKLDGKAYIFPLKRLVFCLKCCIHSGYACVRLSRFSHVLLCTTLWTVALQAPLSMGFSRQECWRGLLFPFPGYLPDLGD